MSPRTKAQNDQIREEREAKIIATAMDLFSAQGFAKTSIREIAKAAKISDGLLYNYFKSKEELAQTVLKSAFQTLDRVIRIDDSQDPKENIRNSISGFLLLLKKEPAKLRLLAQMGLHKDKIELLNQATIAKYQQSVQRFSQNLARAGYPNPEQEARFLVAALDGIVFEHLLMDRPFDLDTVETDLLQKYG